MNLSRLQSGLVGLLLLPLLLMACTQEPKDQQYTKDFQTNFSALWTILDEGYCFFDDKLPASGDTTWSDLKAIYTPRVAQCQSEDEFFDLMVELMCHLKDGHVNLFAPFDVGGWNIREGARHCLDSRIRNLYLQPHMRRAGSIYYAPITYNGHASDSIGYMVIPSFSSSISLVHLHAVFTRLAHCRGLIIAMRSNGGGLLSNADRLASVLIPSDTIVGYMSTKTGPGHQDFGPLKEIQLARAPISWQRPTVILVDRGTYSAANSLVAYVKGTTRHVLFMGDRTGGGGGLPRSSELPNGWWLRYSSSRMYDAQQQSIEGGIEPHIIQEQTEEATAQQQDALIERAIALLLEGNK